MDEKHVMAGGSGEGEANNPNQTPSICSSANDNNKLYKGVRKRKWGKWVSEIRLPNSRERIWLGSYDSAEKAARAFDAALYCLRGPHANFNFPDTPCNLEINVAVPGHQSLTPQEIQEVAAKFANEELPLLNHQESQLHVDGGVVGDSNCSSLAESSNTITYTPHTPTTTATSCSTTMFQCDGTVQMDPTMDWTFLNVFDYSNDLLVPVASDYALYSQLDNMHSGEFLYSTPSPLPSASHQIQDANDDDPFSHQSFLWNW